MLYNYITYYVATNVNEPVLCQVSKQIMIHQLPPVLILHMKRFEVGFNEVIKDDRHISFPEILNMAPYCTNECIKVRINICTYAYMYIAIAYLNI